MSKATRDDAKLLLPNAWKVVVTSLDWPFVAEYRFHETRRWRFDWAHVTLMLAIELQGVTFARGKPGRHQTPSGIEGDMEKLNAAVECGWRVLLYSQRQVKDDPVGVIQQIIRVAEMRAT